jgi:segregation and condensation protein B
VTNVSDETAEMADTQEEPDEASEPELDASESDDLEAVARVRAALEAVFFAADEPLSRSALAKVLPDTPESLLDRALRQLELEFAGPMRGIHLALVAGGWQFRTNPDLQQEVLRLFESRPTRLSKAALETLAIVAYRQPVTRAIVEEIRGVDCGGVLKTLQDYGLATVVGKMDDIGRPNLYGTTDRFLEFFGLGTLEDLPTLEQFEVDSLELLGEDLKQLAEEMELEALSDNGEGEDSGAARTTDQSAESSLAADAAQGDDASERGRPNAAELVGALTDKNGETDG